MDANVVTAPLAVDLVAEASDVPISEPDRADLVAAVRVLERSTLAGRLSAIAGRPLELLGAALPAGAARAVSAAVEAALKAALKLALTTLPAERARGSGASRARLHKAAAAASGAVGGAFGLATLAVELPLSTTLILRAIADAARNEGEDLRDPAVALACLEVFAIGSRSEADDLANGGYFAVRAALANSLGQAARLLAGRAAVDRLGPVLSGLTAQIARRFATVVSQKAVGGAIPVLGAIGGAAVNVAFMDHFQAVAKAHFTVRRLERRYGADVVRLAYEAVRDDEGIAPAI